MKQMVVDSSVVLKWFLPGEVYEAQSLSIFEDFVQRKVEIHVPTIFHYEVLNVIVVSIRRERLNHSKADTALQNFLNLKFPTHDALDLAWDVLQACKEYPISGYDASYLSLSTSLNADFFTADKRLFNNVKKLQFVKWIGDYK
ncbi:MAG: type II toxin-antitoxin system VapC family toxin [Planctomycetes bacterium]|nr:type II toxin-antitoxin system VapC family toxin [Planctomycetota bacterium]